MHHKRQCPNCKEYCEIGTGVYFDDNGNIFCVNCDKPILASTSQVEFKISKLEKKYTSNFDYHYPKNYSAGYQGNQNFSRRRSNFGSAIDKRQNEMYGNFMG